MWYQTHSPDKKTLHRLGLHIVLNEHISTQGKHWNRILLVRFLILQSPNTFCQREEKYVKCHLVKNIKSLKNNCQYTLSCILILSNVW